MPCIALRGFSSESVRFVSLGGYLAGEATSMPSIGQLRLGRLTPIEFETTMKPAATLAA